MGAMVLIRTSRHAAGLLATLLPALLAAACAKPSTGSEATADEARSLSCSRLKRVVSAAQDLQTTRDQLGAAAGGSPQRQGLESRANDQQQVFRRLLLQAGELGTQSRDTRLKAGSSLVLKGGTDNEFAGFDLMREACV
jgi:hypothetical protein